MVARTVCGATSADVDDECSRRRAPRSETRWRSDAWYRVQSCVAFCQHVCIKRIRIVNVNVAMLRLLCSTQANHERRISGSRSVIEQSLRYRPSLWNRQMSNARFVLRCPPFAAVFPQYKTSVWMHVKSHLRLQRTSKNLHLRLQDLKPWLRRHFEK